MPLRRSEQVLWLEGIFRIGISCKASDIDQIKKKHRLVQVMGAIAK